MKIEFTKCDICNRRLVLPSGPEDAPLLLVGEFPGSEEIREGKPFVGQTGLILFTELARVGIAMQVCRTTNLWMHEFDPSMYDEPKHLEWHLARLMEVAAPTKHILMMGSELARLFLRRPITSVCGLQMEVPYFPDKTITFSLNPAAIMHGTLGEVRLAIEKFARRSGMLT